MSIVSDRIYSIATIIIDTESPRLSLTQSQVKIPEKSRKIDFSEGTQGTHGNASCHH
jgi:hypothetical protein